MHDTTDAPSPAATQPAQASRRPVRVLVSYWFQRREGGSSTVTVHDGVMLTVVFSDQLRHEFQSYMERRRRADPRIHAWGMTGYLSETGEANW